MAKTAPTADTEVLAVTQDENIAMSTGDVDLYLSLLDEEAIFLPPNAAAKSAEELRARLRDFLTRFHVEWIKFQRGQVIVDRQLAVCDYTYAMLTTEKPDGPSVVSQGKGVEVLRRHHGSWKIVRNIWNAVPQERPGGR